jgi:hypothetical protein
MSGWSISCEAQENQTKPAPTSSTGAKDNSKSEVDSSPADPQTNSYDTSLGPHLLKDFAYDQKAIWTSPAHLRLVDADWFLPLGVVAGGMLATDTETSKHLSNSPNRIKYGKDLSNYGLASMVAAGGGLYLWGHITHDDHKREAGLLAGEAAVNSLTATYALKYALGRERPLQDNYQGDFWKGGDSFPSEHAAAAWSIASVIAHEYPSPYVKLLAYGLAAAVSASRVDAKQHFPSDVLIGSAIGWFVGEEVYRRHHDPEVGGGDWETYAESQDESPARNRTRSGSPYVQLDSWIYPAIERLAALGYIRSEFLGMRPWTRIECAHLVEEAGDQLASEGDSDSEGASQLYYSLQNEFQGDLDALGDGHETAIRLESLYSGTTGINGKPLNDSYHFGQTIINNYGRPYQEGLNNYDGFSGYGTAGRFTLYVRGEYQHSPFAPAYSLPVRQAIATADANPLQPATPFEAVNRFSLLDTYVAANISGWDLAFGKQSLWWGPGEGGAVMFSDNAEPIYMFRASRIAAFELPWIFHLMGPAKFDLFFGKLSGHEFPARPLIHGEKISFKPTPNLEFGFSRTTVFSGVGRASLTLGLLKRTYFSVGSGPGANSPSDLFQNDHRSPFNPGIYMPHIPLVPKMDLRVEAVYTDVPNPETTSGGFFIYWNGNYHDSYTNNKNILGSWIGREGKGVQAWSTYWFSPRNSIQLGYRHAKVSPDFIPAGETVDDGSVKASLWVHSNLSLSGSVQYEKWLAPILAPGPQTNWTSSIQLTFYPHSWSW